MPIKDSTEKGNMYIKINVHIPDFEDEELTELQAFFNKRK